MPTAFRGIINKGKKNKAAILVEYDALRGIGHACGHCASAAISTLVSGNDAASINWNTRCLAVREVTINRGSPVSAIRNLERVSACRHQ